MFMGEFTHTLDDKGRLTIPARFREELAYGAIVTRGYEKNLVLYAAEAFKRLTTRAENLTPTDPNSPRSFRVVDSLVRPRPS